MFYRLAFKANNDAAERFQAYIADEVFPALRKNGFYAVAEKDPIDQIINNPDAWLKLVQAHSKEKNRNKELQKAVTIMAPKAQTSADFQKRHRCRISVPSFAFSSMNFSVSSGEGKESISIICD